MLKTFREHLAKELWSFPQESKSAFADASGVVMQVVASLVDGVGRKGEPVSQSFGPIAE